MNYFQPYSFPADATILAAWDSQVAEAAETPGLAAGLAKRGADLFPRFAACYADLRALPRGARRALQRGVARSREFAIPRERQKKLAASIAGAAFLLALAQSAHAATLNVTTNIPDINDGDGQCSLIEAMVNANNDAATHPDCAAGSGSDTIVLPSNSTHTLTNFYGSPTSMTGLPRITSQITIEGNGASIVGRSPFVVISVLATGDASLHDLTLRDSSLGVFNAGTLMLENSAVLNNANTNLYFNGLFVTGGGVRNTGSLTVINSVISGNRSFGRSNRPSEGGGISNANGSVLIQNSTVSGNIAEQGGGISSGFYQASMTIQNSTISANTAVTSRTQGLAAGGGIRNSGSLTVENSTISGNAATGSVSSYARGVGAGISNVGQLVVENSTISRNTATGHPSYGAGAGGGLSNKYGSFTLSRNLISGNSATTGAEVETDSNATVDNFNLFGQNNAAGVAGFTPGPTDIVPKVPLKNILAPLADNGGPTDTHALIKGSPGVDAAPVDSDCPATDQRGIARPQGGGCDIGAFELEPKKKKN